MRRWAIPTSSCGAHSRASGHTCHPMRNRPIVAIVIAGAAFIASLTRVYTAPQEAPAARAADAQAHLATIKQYCVACHNDRAKTGGVSFEGITSASIGQQAEVFEKAVRKLRGRVMPP